MSLCKFTLGVAAGIAGALLYDAYKKGEISCCIGSCCRKGEECLEKGKQAVDKTVEKGEKLLHEAADNDRRPPEGAGSLGDH